MKIRTEQHAVEVEFVDRCGCRKVMRVESDPDGETVTITASTYKHDGTETELEEVKDASLSAFKAVAAAILLLEV